MTDTMTARRASKRTGQSETYVDRWWHARIWLGFSFLPWMRLLWRNGFAVHWRRWPSAAIITVVSLGHSFLRLWQQLIFGRRIAGARLKKPPVFVIGHWRSGTTLLHELLASDPRHAYPTNYQCYTPHHFLLTEWLVPRLFGFLLPARRPMDNVPVGWSRPQEDEFALCALGQPSPYCTMAFPNREQWPEYLNLTEAPPAGRARWRRALVHFVKALTLRNNGRRIILKSPTHTGRIKTLLEAFPGARFVHIVREPCVVFQSTVNLWTRMYETQYMQSPRCDELEERVFRTLNHMYEGFEQARGLIPPGHFHELRYEELVRDPLEQMETVYRRLELGDFAAARPYLDRYLHSVRGYQTNRYEMSQELKARIRRRWRKYAEKYGYAETGVSAPMPNCDLTVSNSLGCRR